MSKPVDPNSEPKRRHRRKFQLETIHVDELLNAAGMSGFLAVLEPPKATSPHLEQLAQEMLEEVRDREGVVPERYQPGAQPTELIPETGIPFSGTPDQRLPVTGIPQTEIPDSGIPDGSTPILAIATDAAISTQVSDHGTPDYGVPDKGIPVSGIPPSINITWSSDGSTPVLRSRTLNIRRATLAQDGHSLGEQAVYRCLWDNAKPYGQESRIISVGYRTLSSLCHLTVNNCKANLQSLTRKLSIEEVASHQPTQGKTYLIHSYNAILRRRRAAGLSHYIKTRGVTFVDPDTGREIDCSGVPVSGIPPSESGTPLSVFPGIPDSGTLTLGTILREVSPPSSSSDLTPISRTLNTLAIPFDDDALSSLWSACTQHRPAVTPEEVASAIQHKLAQINPLQVRNLVGFLITAIPRSLSATDVPQPPDADAQSTFELPELETRSELERILNDPNATEDDRRFARRLLALES